jgi:hypothetical protein
MPVQLLTKSVLSMKMITYQVIGYGLLLFLIVGDEIFDFPHTIFGFQATPVNWVESVIEGSYILVLGVVSLFFTVRLLKRIKFLEGFLSICSYCKRIHAGKEWTTLEEYVSNHSEALFSHGLCPDCAGKYYGDFLHRKKTAPDDVGSKKKA